MERRFAGSTARQNPEVRNEALRRSALLLAVSPAGEAAVAFVAAGCWVPRWLAVPPHAAYFGCTQVPKVTEPPTAKHSEPIFNIPAVVIATMVVLIAVHLFRVYVLSDAEDVEFLLTFAFVPARYGFSPLAAALPGGFGAALWTFFTYAFVHADFLHISLNLAWLLPFGTALARRFGAWRYVLFMLVTAAAGALAHLVSHPGQAVPMIGASAAISGAMAAAMRFIFQADGPLESWRDGLGRSEAYRVPAAPLLETLRDSRFLLFFGVWIGLNLLIGFGTISIAEKGQEIAWQAHIGGFVAGLLLFNAFDPVVSPRQLDVEPSA
jgi:membrane associated rhomboid family serine protease